MSIAKQYKPSWTSPLSASIRAIRIICSVNARKENSAYFKMKEFVKKMFILTADLKCTVSHYVYTNKAPLTMSQMCKEIMRVCSHIHAIFGSG